MILWCVKHGIPYDVAYAMEEWEIFAHAVTFSEFENGKEFDWVQLRFPPDNR